jgi:hypothetical protein
LISFLSLRLCRPITCRPSKNTLPTTNTFFVSPTWMLWAARFRQSAPTLHNAVCFRWGE